jgi:hypothetical protein
LEVVAPKVAGDINAFANKVQTRMRFCHHRLTIQRFGINTTEHHLCFFPAQGASRLHRPLL